MTRIKFCGIRRDCEIQAVNTLKPDFIGFVFAQGSKRYVEPEQARRLKESLIPGIQTVGVFVNADVPLVGELLNEGVIDLAQLHGKEDEAYIRSLRSITEKPLIQAFRMDTEKDREEAIHSSADYILLDSGNGGTGTVFDWSLIREIYRPFFLAGGLNPENVGAAIADLHPFAVDVSSGIETDGKKDMKKMAAFLAAAGKEEQS